METLRACRLPKSLKFDGLQSLRPNPKFQQLVTELKHPLAKIPTQQRIA
jgi:hypothetical protein